MPECRCCKENNDKRIVIQDNGLKDITNSINQDNGVLKEFVCLNLLRVKLSWGRNQWGKKNYRWFTEECNNHVIVLKNKKFEKKEVIQTNGYYR